MTRRSIGVVGALGIAGLLLLSVLLLQSLDWVKGSSPGAVAMAIRDELEPNLDASAGDVAVQARVIRVGTGRDAARIYEIRLRLSDRVSANARTSAAVLEAAARLASDTLTTVYKPVTLDLVGERTAGPPVRRSWLRTPDKAGARLEEIVEAPAPSPESDEAPGPEPRQGEQDAPAPAQDLPNEGATPSDEEGE